MIRITTLLWVALLVIAGGTVLRVSYQVRHLEKHIADVAKQTGQEHDAIRVLQAEWDTLNDPQRLDALAKRHLALEPTPVQRVATLDAIPFKPTEAQLAALVAAKGVNDRLGKSPARVTVSSHEGRPPLAQLPVTLAVSTVSGASHDGLGLILARANQR